MQNAIRQRYLLILTIVIMAVSCLNPICQLEMLGFVNQAYSASDEGQTYLSSVFHNWRSDDALMGESFQESIDDLSRICMLRVRRVYNLGRNVMQVSGSFELLFFEIIFLLPAIFLFANIIIIRWDVINYIHHKDGEKVACPVI